MKKSKFQIAVIALMFMSAVGFAQTSWGAAASLIIPTGNFSDMTQSIDGGGSKIITHGTGFGASAIGKYAISDFLTMVGTIGFNSTSEDFEALVPEQQDNVEVNGSGNYNWMDFTVGARANVSFAYVEARLGYYTGDFGGFAFVPAIGAEFGKFDVQANYSMVGDGSNFGIRLGYYFL